MAFYSENTLNQLRYSKSKLKKKPVHYEKFEVTQGHSKPKLKKQPVMNDIFSKMASIEAGFKKAAKAAGLTQREAEELVKKADLFGDINF